MKTMAKALSAKVKKHNKTIIGQRFSSNGCCHLVIKEAHSGKCFLQTAAMLLLDKSQIKEFSLEDVFLIKAIALEERLSEQYLGKLMQPSLL